MSLQLGLYHPILIYKCTTGDISNKYVVIEPSHWDLAPFDGSWMGIEEIKADSLIPDVDLIHRYEIFNDEQSALKRVAELYAEQLERFK